MANYADHINQAKKNLIFLQEINLNIANRYWDWSVTVSYYVAVHLVNAHIAKISNQHYRKHDEVAKALNPYNELSPSKVPEEIYVAYSHLQNLSRRSRYLISDNLEDRNESSNLTYDKHFKKSLVHLEKLLDFIQTTHGQQFEKTTISNCIEARRVNFRFFTVI